MFQIQELFSEVPDPRRNTPLKKHYLSDILTISLLATISGCNSDEEIAEYGKAKISFLSTFLALPNGIPSHDTFTRVFRVLDKEKFASCLYKHSKLILRFVEEEAAHIQIDGKLLRATRSSSSTGICILSAWAGDHNVVLGQVRTEQKSNEQKAIPDLIEELEVRDALVTIDAAGNSPEIAQQIVSKGGHYLLALKKNQGLTFEQVHDFMKARMSTSYLSSYQDIDFGSGRIETRTCYVSDRVDLMEQTQKWKDIQSVIMIHSKREIKGKVEEAYRFYLSDKKESPEYFNERVREHWSIENKLHWQLDVTFREDQCRTRMANGAENKNTLRKIALQFIRKHPLKKSVEVKRKKAAWSNDFLLEIIHHNVSY